MKTQHSEIYFSNYVYFWQISCNKLNWSRLVCSCCSVLTYSS